MELHIRRGKQAQGLIGCNGVSDTDCAGDGCRYMTRLPRELLYPEKRPWIR